MSEPFRQLWPVERDLSDDELTEVYAPTDRSQPLLRVNFVTSVDGAVTVDGYSKGLGGPADLAVFARLRMVCDALLVGAGTLRHENYKPIRLDDARQGWRRDNGLRPQPTLVLVSERLSVIPEHPALDDAPVRPIVITHAGSPADRRKALETKADVLICGQRAVDFGVAVGQLHQRGLVHILSEGGPHVLGSLTQQDLVDELCLTFAPLLAGPGAGRITAAMSPVENSPRPLALASLIKAGDVLLSRYVRSRSRIAAVDSAVDNHPHDRNLPGDEVRDSGPQRN